MREKEATPPHQPLKRPKFLIVTPSLNQGDFIEETITSVLSQKVDLEYWVMDGGSTDQTLAILRRYAKRERRFHYVSEADRGQSEALNKGIAKGEGRRWQLFAYLNSDDVYLPGALKKVEQAVLRVQQDPSRSAEEKEKIGWFYGRGRLMNERGEEIGAFFSKVKQWVGRRYSYFKLLCLNPFFQPAVFIKRSALEATGNFNLSLKHTFDYEYWLRLGKRYLPKEIPHQLAKFRLHSASKTTTETAAMYRSELALAWRHCPRSSTYPSPYLLAVGLHLFHYCAITTWMRLLPSK